MPTVLRVSGKNFDVDTVLQKTKLKFCRIFHKGEPRFLKKKEKLKESGFCLDTSRLDFDDSSGQIRQTISFLKKNQKVLKNLVKVSGVEAVIDFGFSRGGFVQFVSLPAELIRLAASIGLALEISLYSISTEGKKPRT